MPLGRSPTTSLLDPDRAVELVLEHTPTDRVTELPLERALGGRLAAPLVASCPLPPFARALMDGFAVRLSDAGKTVAVSGEAAAGQRSRTQVAEGEAVEIMTGAPCPPGTEAVVKVEDVTRQGDRVTLPAAIAPDQHLQPAGSLGEAGETIVSAGSTVTPLSMATAIACGCSRAHVFATPTLTVVTTGDELTTPGDDLPEGSIYDSNGPMLVAMARALGVVDPVLLHAADDRATLERVLARAATTDIVVLSGGVSMGRYDLVPEIVKAVGADVVFHKVRQKPGKPLLFARRAEQLLFGLPGTPLGSHLGFHRYVAACIRKWTGRTPTPAPLRGRLSTPIKVQGQRTLFRLVRAERDGAGWRLDPLRWRGSSDVIGPALANAYIRVEPGPEPLAADTELDWEPIEGEA